MSIHAQTMTLDELTNQIQVGGIAVMVALAIGAVGFFVAIQRSFDPRIRMGVGVTSAVLTIGILFAFAGAISTMIIAAIVVGIFVLALRD